MSLFSDVKTHINTQEAARRYGLEVNRYGKAFARFTTTGIPVCMWQMTTITATPAGNTGMSST